VRAVTGRAGPRAGRRWRPSHQGQEKPIQLRLCVLRLQETPRELLPGLGGERQRCTVPVGGVADHDHDLGTSREPVSESWSTMNHTSGGSSRNRMRFCRSVRLVSRAAACIRSSPPGRPAARGSRGAAGLNGPGSRFGVQRVGCRCDGGRTVGPVGLGVSVHADRHDHPAVHSSDPGPAGRRNQIQGTQPLTTGVRPASSRPPSNRM